MEFQNIREFVEFSEQWVEQIRNCIADAIEAVTEFAEQMQKLFELATESEDDKVKTKQNKTLYCSIKESRVHGLFIFGYPTGFL